MGTLTSSCLARPTHPSNSTAPNAFTIAAIHVLQAARFSIADTRRHHCIHTVVASRQAVAAFALYGTGFPFRGTSRWNTARTNGANAPLTSRIVRRTWRIHGRAGWWLRFAHATIADWALFATVFGGTAWFSLKRAARHEYQAKPPEHRYVIFPAAFQLSRDAWLSSYFPRKFAEQRNPRRGMSSGVAHRPSTHEPSQQPSAVVHISPRGEHVGDIWHVSSRHDPSQQSPVVEQGRPLGAHVGGIAHTPSWHELSQQSRAGFPNRSTCRAGLAHPLKTQFLATVFSGRACLPNRSTCWRRFAFPIQAQLRTLAAIRGSRASFACSRARDLGLTFPSHASEFTTILTAVCT